MKRALLIGVGTLVALVVAGTALTALAASPDSRRPTSDGTIPITAVQYGDEEPDLALLADDSRVAPPRDPFKPLIFTTTTTSTSTTSTTMGNNSSTSTSTTMPGSTTSTTEGFDPDTVLLRLEEIQSVNGVLRAVVTVDGVRFVLLEGQEFANGFKLVTLFSDRAVFSYKGRLFELRVGEQIEK